MKVGSAFPPSEKTVKSATKVPNVVVGGGIIGLLAAWYLSKVGEKVIVIEKHRVGKQSSRAGAGILSPLYPARYPFLSSLVRYSRDEYPCIVEELVRSDGRDPELLFSELIVLDDDKETIICDEIGPTPRRIVVDEALQRMEPALKVPPGRTTCYPAAQIQNPRLLSALQSILTKRGVIFLEGKEVQGFRWGRGQLTGLRATHGTIEASRCVVAAGAWAGGLLKTTGLVLPIKPIKGQIVTFAAAPRLITRIIVKDYRYLVPRSNGRILVGSTIEDTGFDSSPTLAAREALYSAAVSLVPALEQYPIEHHWAGLRPGSPDDAPFIGEHPEIKGLFVCAGHYRNGFATGPASARLVADMMLGRPPSVDPTPFRLDRPCPDWKI
ncbi:MAG: NAD(P)/FAD-dependent oxidoreductase [Gammaproteobacteria bacterium]